ncbi:MAG: acetyltransferase [Coxiellaceae bacterium]|nr:acetyltransferase [Coxiellaceae bacterium]
MKKQLVIVGAGGLAREMVEFIEDVQKEGVDWQIVGFIDDNIESLTPFKMDYPMLGNIANYQPNENSLHVLAVGNPKIRQAIYNTLQFRGAVFITTIHPTAYVSRSAKIEKGVFIAPFVFVSANATIKQGAYINIFASIGHDAKVGDFSIINGHCSVNGNAILGRRVFLGAHVAIAPGIEIKDNARVAAGSSVIRRVRADQSVMGVPAEPFKIG